MLSFLPVLWVSCAAAVYAPLARAPEKPKSAEAILRDAYLTELEALGAEAPEILRSEDSVRTLLGMAWAESRLGEAGDWKGSHNWGAVHVWNRAWGALSHADHDAEGHPIVVRFQRYPSALEGARGMLTHTRAFRSPDVRALLADGADPVTLSRALYREGYFSGTSGTDEDRIVEYARTMISGPRALVDRALGEPAFGDM